jgi:bacterioferritin
MKGKPKVVQALNEALTAELTAINQYMIHAMMCKNWGYAKLAEAQRKEAIEEMKHAEVLIDRILFLDGVPNMQKYNKVVVGTTVQEQIENDLKAELDAVRLYNAGMKISREAEDNGSAEVFEALLKDEEEHVDHLEAQLHMIGEMGIQNFLALQA